MRRIPLTRFSAIFRTLGLNASNEVLLTSSIKSPQPQYPKKASYVLIGHLVETDLVGSGEV